MKHLIHICLETEAHGSGMTFNICYVGSKYPYFISNRGKWVYIFLPQMYVYWFLENFPGATTDLEGVHLLILAKKDLRVLLKRLFEHNFYYVIAIF